jgi:hypothetical protein
MKPEDKDKLNECIKILESTDLGLSLVWLWTWDVIKYNMQDADFVCTVTEDQMWEHLCEAVEAGQGFSLEYGAEQLSEDVRDWMMSRGYLVDPTDVEEEDEEEDEDE